MIINLKRMAIVAVMTATAVIALRERPTATAAVPPISPFTIGVDCPPSNLTNDTTYEQIRNFNATLVFSNAGVGVDGFGPVDMALKTAAAHHLKMVVSNTELITLDNGGPDDATVASIVQHYNNIGGAGGSVQAALEGYFITDEPRAPLFPQLQNTIGRFRQADPSRMTFVNLLPLGVTSTSAWQVQNFSGDFVTPAQSLGQTFKTQSNLTKIHTVELAIDSAQWTTGELLTLTLWDSPSKRSPIAQQTLSPPGDNFPIFTLEAAVSPNTTYYMELTHNGGGDQSVGWVNTSVAGEKFVNDGTGYKGGTPASWDLWFVINQPRLVGGTYDDYVYRWADKSPDVLVYDDYPFKICDGLCPTPGLPVEREYFENLEIIRMQAQSHGRNFWMYIQSVGSTSSNMRVPTASEMRFQIYTLLTYGARGYLYFAYWTPPPSTPGNDFHDAIIKTDGTQSPSYGWGQAINGEVLKLGPTLTTLTSKNIYHTGMPIPDNTVVLPADFFMQPTDGRQPVVVGYFKNGAGRKYLMLTNRDTVAGRTVSYTFNPKPSTIKEVSKVSGAEVSTTYNGATGVLQVTFAAGDGHLFALPTGY